MEVACFTDSLRFSVRWMTSASHFFPQWEAYQLSEGRRWDSGPECGLSESEVMTLLVMYHGSHFRHLKSFYNGVALSLLKRHFPGLPCYERFVQIQAKALVPLTLFFVSKSG